MEPMENKNTTSRPKQSKTILCVGIIVKMPLFQIHLPATDMTGKRPESADL